MRPIVSLWLCRVVATATFAAGCSDGGSAGSFTLGASSHVDIPVGGSGTVHIQIVPSPDFHDPVRVTVVSPPGGVTADPLSVMADSPSGDLTLHVAAGTTLDASLTIQGESLGGVQATTTVAMSAGVSGGLLDPAFGDNGITPPLVSVFLPDEQCGMVTTQGDGKVLVALPNVFEPGRLVRVDVDGTADAMFGTNGHASLIGHSGMGTTPLAVAFTPDQKILVLGYESLPPASPKPILWRFSADGTPDASLGGGGSVSLSGVAALLGGLSVREDGGLDVIGRSAGAVVTARLTADGQLDSSYGEGGKTSFPASGTALRYVRLADGGWLVTLMVASGTLSFSSTLVKVTSSGASGAATTDVEAVSNLQVAGDGYLDVAVKFSLQSVMSSLERRRSDLTLDPSFGTAGSVPLDALSVVDDAIASNDGKVMLFGDSDDLGSRPVAKISRLSADGTIDVSFRIGGTATLAGLLGGEPYATACSSSFAVDAAGRIVFATLDAQGRLRVLRFLP